WGFAWELGPFELWDVLGVERMVQCFRQEKRDLPPLVARLLASGKKSFYESAQGELSAFDPASSTFAKVPEPPGIIILKSLRDRSREIAKNAGASLID